MLKTSGTACCGMTLNIHLPSVVDLMSAIPMSEQLIKTAIKDAYGHGGKRLNIKRDDNTNAQRNVHHVKLTDIDHLPAFEQFWMRK